MASETGDLVGVAFDRYLVDLLLSPVLPSDGVHVEDESHHAPHVHEFAGGGPGGARALGASDATVAHDEEKSAVYDEEKRAVSDKEKRAVDDDATTPYACGMFAMGDRAPPGAQAHVVDDAPFRADDDGAGEEAGGCTESGPEEIVVDVLVVGAGPVGLTLANALGAHGVRVLLVEKRTKEISDPRYFSLNMETMADADAYGIGGELRNASRDAIP